MVRKFTYSVAVAAFTAAIYAKAAEQAPKRHVCETRRREQKKNKAGACGLLWWALYGLLEA